VFVVWEPVLVTDWRAPSTETLKRVSDPRAIQFWDKGRLLSRAMGEHDKKSIVWDEIIVYGPDAAWKKIPPEPFYRGGPVLDVIEPARAAIGQLLASSQRSSNPGMIGAERQPRMVPSNRVPTLLAGHLCKRQGLLRIIASFLSFLQGYAYRQKASLFRSAAEI
jgi:hypothetical protein